MAPAIHRAAASLVLHPVSAAIGLAASVVALAILALPIAAAAMAWGALRHEVLGAGDPARVIGETLLFAALWLAGLAVAGATSTLRASIWTWHALRTRSTVPLALGAPIPAPESKAAEA